MHGDSLPAMDRTLVICKPDSVERGLVGEILGRFETKGLKLVAAELRTLDTATLARHYEEHVGKPFYDGLVEFMSRGPALVAVIEGPGRHLEGRAPDDGGDQPARERARAPSGAISAPCSRRTSIHGSDSLESAQREIGIFFPEL